MEVKYTIKERDEMNDFVKEASDIGFDLFKQRTKVDHQNLVLALVATFLKKCDSEAERDLLRTTVGLVIKDSVEHDMKEEVMSEMSEDFEKFAYEKAKENGRIQ